MHISILAEKIHIVNVFAPAANVIPLDNILQTKSNFTLLIFILFLGIGEKCFKCV